MTAKKNYYFMPEGALVPNLNFGFHEEVIRVRIIRVWDDASYRAPDEMATYFILLDEEVINPVVYQFCSFYFSHLYIYMIFVHMNRINRV